MMNYLKTYESFQEEYNQDFIEFLRRILENHVQGCPPKFSLWEKLYESGIINSYYKYRGKVWKVFFFMGLKKRNINIV